MNPTLAQAVSFALDVAVKSTLVFAAAAALLFALRRASAATRHLVGTFGLAAALLVPFLTLALPQVRVRLLPDPRPAVRTAAPLSRIAERTALPAVAEPASPRDAIEETSGDPITVDVVAPAPAAVADAKTLRRLARAVPERAVAAADPSALAPAAAPPRPLRLPSAGAVLAAVLGLWALGALAFATRLAVGWVRVRRIARAASPLSDAEWIEERDAAARRLSLGRHVPLVESESVPVAVTSGWRRPLLLIGHAARSWAVERKRVVLLHELAHVKRADWPALLVAELAVATYWFHPAAWWLGRRVRREAEQACDDLVISSGTKPSVYAGHLLGIFRALHSPAHPVAPALAIARPHHFEERLRAILDPVSARGAVSGATARFAAAGLFVAAMSFSAIEPWKDSAPHRSTSTPSASASLSASASESESQSETVSPKAREEQSSLVAVVFRKIANRVARKVEQRVETNMEEKDSAAFQQVTETKVEKTVCESRKKEKTETTPDSGEAVTPEPEAEPEPEPEPVAA